MVPDQNSIMFLKTIARLKNVFWFDVEVELVCSPPPGYYISWRTYLSADSCGWDSKPPIFTFSKMCFYS
uniref:Uncharacterized protein n=1 Tax=Physcomitrium patens TaxID=3218 RepID=A0A7I4A0M2_PHYPA